MNLDLGDTRLIMAECRRYGLTVPQTAYVLATGFWETARTMRPVEEAFYLGSKAEAYRKKLRYYPWHGRGYVQLTWEDNYRKFGITNPGDAMVPATAAYILVRGMLVGMFTGKGLTDYINVSQTDYKGARRIVNGTDKAAEIAALAVQYEAALVAYYNATVPPVIPAPASRGFWASLATALAGIWRGK
jgi:hypothetical protein